MEFILGLIQKNISKEKWVEIAMILLAQKGNFSKKMTPSMQIEKIDHCMEKEKKFAIPLLFLKI